MYELKIPEVIKLRCRASKCGYFNKNNGCIKDEIIITNNGNCNCYMNL